MARTPMSTEAHYLMARHVFEDLDYRRYEWKCHNENGPSKVTAVRLGFQFEVASPEHPGDRRGAGVLGRRLGLGESGRAAELGEKRGIRTVRLADLADFDEDQGPGCE